MDKITTLRPDTIIVAISIQKQNFDNRKTHFISPPSLMSNETHFENIINPRAQKYFITDL